MPVRKIPKNFIHITGMVASHKAIGPAEFEGGLEYDNLLLLEFDWRVANFEVQPVRIPYYDRNGRLHFYTLDGRVKRYDLVKSILCEVKPRSVLKKHWAEFKPKFRAAIRYANQEQCRFKIYTEKEIRTQYLKNVRFLLPCVRRGADFAMQKLLLQALAGVTESTPRKLLNKITDDERRQAEILPALWYLIGTFQVIADLDQRMSMDMGISLP